MKRFVLAAALFATGCYTLSDRMIEEGTIMQTIYQPGQSFTGLGMSTSGNMHVTSGTTDDTYAVVVSCQHGQFVVKSQEVFNKIKQGDRVLIEYREVRDGDNKIYKYEFIDLQRKPATFIYGCQKYSN